MDFDIQTLYDGELTRDEEQFDAFQDALRERFAHSPEWADVGLEGQEASFWAAQFVFYSSLHLNLPLAEVDRDDADEVIYDIFPDEITLTQPEEAKNARPELIAFWRFLKREFGLENADTVLAYLDSMDPEEFTEAMFDPEEFGAGKSLFTDDEELEFNMNDENEEKTFMRVYDRNALSHALSGDDKPLRGGLLSDNPPPSRLYSAEDVKKKKNKRKQAKASRRKNRKK